ncbi:endonuclease domain-containing protein [Candidatus Margulisiibacteriota bacterium]
MRKLRRGQTKAEARFWKAVRNRKLNGLKFYRQYPIVFKENDRKHFFVADFYCYEKKLVIEVDGSIHDCQEEQDELRENIIKELGLNMLRFTNQDIELKLNEVLRIILGFANSYRPSLLREGTGMS